MSVSESFLAYRMQARCGQQRALLCAKKGSNHCEDNTETPDTYRIHRAAEEGKDQEPRCSADSVTCNRHVTTSSLHILRAQEASFLSPISLWDLFSIIHFPVGFVFFYMFSRMFTVLYLVSVSKFSVIPLLLTWFTFFHF